MISFLKQKWRFFLSLLPFKRTRTSTVYSEINRESTPTTRRKHKPRERKKERKRQSRESSLWSYLLTECWDTSIYMFALHEYLSIAANVRRRKGKVKMYTYFCGVDRGGGRQQTNCGWVSVPCTSVRVNVSNANGLHLDYIYSNDCCVYFQMKISNKTEYAYCGDAIIILCWSCCECKRIKTNFLHFSRWKNLQKKLQQYWWHHHHHHAHIITIIAQQPHLFSRTGKYRDREPEREVNERKKTSRAIRTKRNEAAAKFILTFIRWFLFSIVVTKAKRTNKKYVRVCERERTAAKRSNMRKWNKFCAKLYSNCLLRNERTNDYDSPEQMITFWMTIITVVYLLLHRFFFSLSIIQHSISPQ